MATVPAFEAKTKFGELLDRVLKGEEIVITRHERPVARLVAEGLEALQGEIAETSKGKAPLSWKDFKSAIEKGRR